MKAHNFGPAGNGWRWRRWAWIAAVTLLALLLPAAAYVRTHWPFTQDKMIAEVQRYFPGPIRIERFQNLYFPRPGCVAEGVIVQGISHDPAHPMATAVRISVSGSYKTLFAQIKPFIVSAVGLRVYIPPAGQRGEAHGRKPGEPAKYLQRVEVNDSQVEFARSQGEPLVFRLHHLTAGPWGTAEDTSYTLALRNPLPPGEVSASGVIGKWTGELGELPVQGNYRFEQADLGVFSALAGTLESEGSFQGPLAKLAVVGTTHVSNFEICKSHHRVDLRGKFQVDVNGTDGDVLLRDTAFTWGRTTLTATGAITGEDEKTVNVAMAVRNGRIQDLMRLVNAANPTMDGPVVMRGTAMLPPHGGKFLQRVRFTAFFGIDDARFTRVQVQNAVNKLSERARGEKDRDLRQVVSDVRGHVRLLNGVAHIQQALLTVPGASASFNGSCNMIAKTIDLSGQLRMSATLSQASTGFKSLLLKVVDPFFKDRKHRAGSSVPVRITGTFAQPNVGLNLLRKR